MNFDDHEGFSPDRMQRPALVWDGDCGFCKRSVRRLAREVGDRVRYVTYQSVHDRFPEISEDQFARAVHLVEPTGCIYMGAEAIFRAYDTRPQGSRMLELYKRVPGFKSVSEWGYELVAQNRQLASKLLGWLPGGPS